jgi:hypothetical protein
MMIGVALMVLGVCAPSMLSAVDEPLQKTAPPPSNRGELVRTAIKIVELRRTGEWDYSVRVDVDSESRNLQTLIFVQDHKSRQFGLAYDRTPKTFPPGFPFVESSRPGGLIWRSEFSSVFKHPSIKVFAVVAEIGGNARVDRKKEFDSLRYLPFMQETEIEGVLQLLANFQWRPQGYTFLDAPY